MSIDHFLLIVSAICFLVAAVGYSTGKLNCIALGLFCWILTLLV